MTNSIDELADTDCIFIIGSNTTSSHPIIATRIFRAKQKGAKIIVADPRNIQLGRFADLAVTHRLGTLAASEKKTRQDAPGAVDGVLADVQHPARTNRSEKMGGFVFSEWIATCRPHGARCRLSLKGKYRSPRATDCR